jgi:RND family efflux transporter MFP subunit
MNRSKSVLLPILLAALSAACTKQKPVEAKSNAPEPPLTIKAAKAESRQVDRMLAATGSLVADESVNLVFEVPGRIAAIRTDFGQYVKQGQVLAELDRTDYALQLERARASLTQALARVGLDGSQVNAKAESTASMRQAQAQMEDAWNKFESARKLKESGDISEQRFIEAEKAYRARLAGVEATKDDLRVQMAAIDALKTEIKIAEKRLTDTVLRAPFDGAIAARPASPGQYVKDNATVVKLVKTWPLRLRVEVPESESVAAKAGTTLVFTTDSAPGAEFHARVTELNPTLDARSRTLVAEARIVENDSRLKPGGFVQVKLVSQRGVNITVVPRGSIHTIAGLTKIFPVRSGKTTEVRFVPGQEVGNGWVEVPGDAVKPGELVATTSLGQLYTGRAVSAN